MEVLSNPATGYTDRVEGVGFTDELVRVMRHSIHPPHVAEDMFGDGLEQVSSAAFPFCWYDEEGSGKTGTSFGPYGDK